MKEGYAGKIGNHGSQTVEAVYSPDGGKSPKVKQGGDLRTGK